MTVSADLHIHSCLSPCGSLEMSPSRIIQEAAAAGLDLIALTDHNSVKNYETLETCAGITAAAGKHVPVCLPGMEINTREEVHVLGIFPDAQRAREAGEAVYRSLPDVEADPERFGDQVYVDENEMIIGEVRRYLGNAVSMTIEEVVGLITCHGGLCIPAHVDRPMHGIFTQLGFLPDLEFAALEVLRNRPAAATGDYTLIQNSDAHIPGQIGRRRIEFECRPGELQTAAFETLRRVLETGDLRCRYYH